MAKQIIVILAASAALLAGMWMGYYTKPDMATGGEPQGIQGTILPSEKIIDAFELTSNRNEAFSNKNLRGKWSLLFIGYTHCPDVCPATLETVKQVHGLMLEQGLTPPDMVFISVDPERDTSEILDQYVTYFNKDFIGLTGSKENIAGFVKQLSGYYAKAAGTSGDINNSDYLMDHTASLMLVNPQGNLQAYLSAPHTPMKVIDGIVRTQAFYAQQK
ncbi:MAG: SCO family protein [Gammaproteobacteria bacterium]|nr:SCO family protein [Gammaproteobacteria bacterium]